MTQTLKVSDYLFISPQRDKQYSLGLVIEAIKTMGYETETRTYFSADASRASVSILIKKRIGSKFIARITRKSEFEQYEPLPTIKWKDGKWFWSWHVQNPKHRPAVEYISFILHSLFGMEFSEPETF